LPTLTALIASMRLTVPGTGFLVVKVHVNTVVVTLGRWTLIDGVPMLLSSDNTISGLPSSFSKIALTEVGGLPVSFYYGVGLYFLETGILGLRLHGLQNWVTNVFYGGVLVVAVTISTLPVAVLG
jgi:ribose/xylose/arabinose/galactoside ABC-type transport system permease subunit